MSYIEDLASRMRLKYKNGTDITRELDELERFAKVYVHIKESRKSHKSHKLPNTSSHSPTGFPTDLSNKESKKD